MGGEIWRIWEEMGERNCNQNILYEFSFKIKTIDIAFFVKTISTNILIL